MIVISVDGRCRVVEQRLEVGAERHELLHVDRRSVDDLPGFTVDSDKRFVPCPVATFSQVIDRIAVQIAALPGEKRAQFASEIGILTGIFRQRFPLEQAGEAHAYIESRQAFGRVLLIP